MPNRQDFIFDGENGPYSCDKEVSIDHKGTIGEETLFPQVSTGKTWY